MSQIQDIETIPQGHATDLETIENITPTVLFSEGGSKLLLEKIRAEIGSVVVDISTQEGRDDCAALAYKIARSKTLLDKIGKALNADIKKQAKIIDDQRSHIWDELEAMQKRVRAPLTAYEEKEKARSDAHSQALQQLEALTNFDAPPSTSDIEARRSLLLTLSCRDWEEHEEIAQQSSVKIGADLDVRLHASLQADAEREELERLRASQLERDADDARRKKEEAMAEAKRQREIEIAEAEKVASSRAQADAAEKVRAAEAQAQRAEADKIAAIKAAEEKAERDRIAASKKAEDDAAAAVRAEQARIAEADLVQRNETLKREANRAYCAKINNEIVDAITALSDAGIKHEQAKKIVEAIALDKIPHTKIFY